MPNLAQSFIDTQVGVVLGTVLHTLGAIAFLGGLVGYIAWHRHLKVGHHHRAVLTTSSFLAYLAIVVNLLGGFMRTYETGHPHITQFGESAWVRAIAIKHIFLFAAYGAIIYLFEVVAPRHLRAMKAGKLEQASLTGHRLGVLIVTVGIVVSALLGGVSQVLPIDEMEEDDHVGAPTEPLTLYENATGQLTSTPVQPATARSTFQVVPGTTSLNATLSWTPDQFTLVLTLTAPDGKSYAPGAVGAGRLDGDVVAPIPGTWDYQVASDFALNAAWTLTIAMPQGSAADNVVADTVTVAPGAGHEINTQMANGSTIQWDWTASAVLHFNVHSHFDGNVQDYVNEDDTEGRGSFTVQRAGGYSLYWTNDGAVPVTLTYRVFGSFELDSIT